MKSQRASHAFDGRLKRFSFGLAIVMIGLATLNVHGEKIYPASDFPGANSVDGVATFDELGGIGLTRSEEGPSFFSQLQTAQTSAEYITQGLDGSLLPADETYISLPFFVGFDILRDLDLIADPNDEIVGAIGLDGFGGVHSYVADGANSPDYMTGVVAYNAANDPDIGLPYFYWDFVRDLELAPDWRTATNAFQGYYLLDGFGGVHYVNNAQVMNLIRQDSDGVTSDQVAADPTLGTKAFFDVFGFRPIYRRHFVPEYEVFSANYRPGMNATEKMNVWEYLSYAPYTVSKTPKTPNSRYSYFARDLEVSVRFLTISDTHVNNSTARKNTAAGLGLDEADLTTPISVPATRANKNNSDFGRDVAVTNGYYILSSHGVVHSMLEDSDGNPIPAPWENPKTGMFDSRVNAPYFGFEIAEDLELFPSGLGYGVLTSYGKLYLVTAPGTTLGDSFDLKSFSKFKNSPALYCPYFGWDIARGLKFVTYVDRDNYGMDRDHDGVPDAVNSKHGKIVGYYVLDGYGTVHGVGKVARLPKNGTALPLYNADLSLDIEVSPIYRPVTNSYNKFKTSVNDAVSILYYPVTDTL